MMRRRERRIRRDVGRGMETGGVIRRTTDDEVAGGEK
jgi:hypothetical protein